MEHQPETATALVCGAALAVTAEELRLAGVEVKDPAAFTALSQVVHLQKTILSKITFSDVGWGSLLTGIKNHPHLTHLSLAACGLGPMHTAGLADIFSSGCSIDTLCLAKNGLTGATFDNIGRVRGGVDSDLEGVSTLLTALKASQVIHIDFSGCGLGPGSMGRLGEYLRDAKRSIARISVLSNPIGVEGATALIDVYERNENLRTLLGIEEGVTELNLAKKQVDPGQAMVLAKEFQTGRATASLTKVVITGAEISETDVATLRAAAPNGCEVVW